MLSHWCEAGRPVFSASHDLETGLDVDTPVQPSYNRPNC
jgi:hypothetical protein